MDLDDAGETECVNVNYNADNVGNREGRPSSSSSLE